jgi:hypothetical protein
MVADYSRPPAQTYGVEVVHSAKVITLFSSCNYSAENAAGACLLSERLAHLVSWRRPLVAAQETPELQWSGGLLPFTCDTKVPRASVLERLHEAHPAVMGGQNDHICG